MVFLFLWSILDENARFIWWHCHFTLLVNNSAVFEGSFETEGKIFNITIYFTIFQVSFKITYVLQLINWKINLFLYCCWHCHNDIIIAMTIRMTMLVTLFLVLINIHNTIQTNSPKVSYRSSVNNTVITEEGHL